MSSTRTEKELMRPPGPPGGRRERKKAETRQALRAAAIRLVGERGLDAVTVEDITETADVSLRTFFNYFSSKEQALTASDATRLARLRSALVARPVTETPLQALQAVLTAEIDELAGRRNEWLQQLSVIRTDARLLAALTASWFELEQTLAAGLIDRLGAAQADTAEVLAGTAVAILRVAIRRWNDQRADPLATILTDAFDALVHAIPNRR